MVFQLPLPIRLSDEASFANFHVCEQNRTAIARLMRFIEEGAGSLYLHGPPGSGRSHLLQAACRAGEERGVAVIYLPLAELADAPPRELFCGLETHALLCLDDADRIAGRSDWEEELFHLYNRCRESGCRMVLAAALPPAQAGFGLADLRSRLQGGEFVALAVPDDETRVDVLLLRARNRGLTLERDVAHYIWSRSARSLTALIAVLDRLDSAAVRAGRRLSIPFVKEIMGW